MQKRIFGNQLAVFAVAQDYLLDVLYVRFVDYFLMAHLTREMILVAEILEAEIPGLQQTLGFDAAGNEHLDSH